MLNLLRGWNNTAAAWPTAVLFGCLGAPTGAFAQDAPDTKPSLSADEIVVTARKRDESLQDVPLSISAFSADKLEEVGAFDNEDVALLTPNFSTARQVGRRLDRPTIRGMSAAATGAGPNASYFIDGVFVSGSIQSQTLGPIERVEILRGPQSAQFGRATFAGAVNYVTKKPSNELAGQLKTTIASHDSATVSGWASGPLVRDQFYYFVSAAWDTYGGEYRNGLKDGQAPLHAAAPLTAPTRGDRSRLGGTDTKDFVAKFTWTPTDTSELEFKYAWNKGDDDHYVQLIQELGELNCFLPTWGNNPINPEPGTVDNSAEPWFTTSSGAFCGVLDPERVTYASLNPFNPSHPAFSPTRYPLGFFNLTLGDPYGIGYTLPTQGASREARYNLPDFYEGIQGNPGCLGSSSPADCIAAPAKPGTRRTQHRFLVRFRQDFGDWNWLSDLAYNRDEYQQVFDLDRSEQRPILNNGLFHMLENGEFEDYNLQSRLQSPADGNLTGSIGVNYYKQDRFSHQRRFVGFGSGQFTPKPLAQDIENVAVFGLLEYNLSDQWTLATEARWAQEDRSVDSGLTCITPGPFNGQASVGEITTKSLTPRFTVRYEPSDTSMLYALLAKGDKPAEFVLAYYRNTVDPCFTLAEVEAGGPTVLEQEKAWTYEVGTKKSWLNRRLITNLSLFYIDWKNQGVIQNQLVDGTLTQINVNAGRSEVWGAELETSFVFTDSLSGQFSYGLANNTYQRYNDESLAQTTGVGLVLMPNGRPMRDASGALIYDEAANNAKGNRIQGSPKHSFIFGLNYNSEITLNLLNGAETLDWFARTDFVLETQRYTSATNLTKFPNRKRWNGRVGIESANWTLTAFVNNILDDLTPTSIFGFPAITGATWNNGETPVTGVPNGMAGDGPNQNSVSPAFGRAYGIELTYRFGD